MSRRRDGERRTVPAGAAPVSMSGEQGRKPEVQLPLPKSTVGATSAFGVVASNGTIGSEP